jgi:hypothetical protein
MSFTNESNQTALSTRDRFSPCNPRKNPLRFCPTVTSSFGVLCAALLCLVGVSALAGVAEVAPAASKNPVPVEKKPEANPLCFADGMICIDIQERFRFEARENTFDFNNKVTALNDDIFVLNRFRLGLAFKPTDWLKFYAQGQDAHEWFSDRPSIPGQLGAEGDDNFDLRQAYVQVGPKDLNLTAGRQVLLYGDERLIGPGEWTNFTRTFDASKLHYEQPKFSIDLFASTPVYIFRDSYDQSDFFNGSEAHRDLVFSGVYASTMAVQPVTLDFYALYLHEDNNVPLATTVPPISYPGTTISIPGTTTDFVTLGTRVKSDPKKLHGWEYDGEFAFQTGQVSDLNLQAFALHAGGGYTFENCSWKPRLYAEYNYATGDDDPTDGDIGTFQNLFPSNHNKYGVMDLFAWQNLSSPDIRFRVKPVKQVTLETAFYGFWLADTNDAWYRANGTTKVRPITAVSRNASSYAGSEIDLIVTYQPIKFVNLQAGYSHFFAGDYLNATGRSDDADFGYVQTTLTF